MCVQRLPRHFSDQHGCTSQISMDVSHMIMIISVFTEDNKLSMNASLSYGPPMSTCINYYQTVSCPLLNPCHTRAAFSRGSHGVKEKSRTPRCVQYNRKHRRSNAVASPVDVVGSHRMWSDSTHFEHAQNKRRRSAF